MVHTGDNGTTIAYTGDNGESWAEVTAIKMAAKSSSTVATSGCFFIYGFFGDQVSRYPTQSPRSRKTPRPAP